MENYLNYKFKALVLHSKEDLRYEEYNFDFENLGRNSLVVKVTAAGLGPYELGFVIGRLKIPESTKTTNIGVEGCGVVVKVGKNCSSELLGKRVSFLVSNFDSDTVRSYSEYSVVNKDSIIELPDSIDDGQGAYLMANPVTAHILFNSTIKSHKAIIQDTASSALGKMITKLCVKNGIKIINIVRKQDNVQMMNDLGSSYTLNFNSNDFWKTLPTVVQELSPSLYITYQGGYFPSQVFDKLPMKSVMCCCGNINNELLSGYSSTDFIFKGKIITGFQVLKHLDKLSAEEKSNIYNSIIQDISNGDNIYYTQISKEFKFSEWDEARKFYESNMSKGKIILKP